ncbi:hypothetical protein LTR37_006615 [Vermiconidia calcicola]|uniref:Uncharacterized protein n=1 Tax=Vermiconidia calcicola TaxID=1690605 RepID=A0ACC3NGA9_9PEZI|nr:hypothetical protein LTR37_006615 [Vermiconidia calcicola]
MDVIKNNDNDNSCAHLKNPNPYTVFLAAFILVGILVSYLPQHIKIITRRSSEGLSPWWVLLGGLSSIAAIGNILVLPQSRADIGCCKVVNGGECAAALLGIAQIGLQWACFMFIVLLFLTFFPTHRDMSASTPSLTSTSPPPKRRDALAVTTAILASLLATFLTSLAIIASSPPKSTLPQTWADILGTIAGTLAAIQYIPQIYFTWKLKGLGSLSIVTMVIQVPGAFLFAFSLGLRVGWEGWSTWLVYIVTGILQGILLGMGITYFLAARARAKGGRMDDDNVGDNEGEDVEGPAVDDRTTLLANGQNKTRPINGTHNSTQGTASQRQLSMLYAATPPEHDSESS